MDVDLEVNFLTRKEKGLIFKLRCTKTPILSESASHQESASHHESRSDAKLPMIIPDASRTQPYTQM